MSVTSLSPVAAAYYVLPVISTGIVVALGYWVHREHGHRRGVRWFVATLLAAGAHNALFAVHLVWPATPFTRTIASMAGFFAFTSYGAFTVFAGRYTDTDYHRRWPVAAALVVMIGGYVFLAVLSPFHDLWTSNPRVVDGPMPYYTYDLEPGLGVVVVVAFLLGAYNITQLVRYLFSTSARATRQVTLLIAAVASVVIVSGLSFTEWLPATQLDHTPYATLPFALFVTAALFGSDLLTVRPVARNAVVEDLRDPVLVLDEDRRVVDYNAASTAIWPDLPDALGDPLGDACPELTTVGILADGDGLADSETGDAEQLTLDVDGQTRHYSVRLSALADGDDAGNAWRSVLLRDVTEIEQSRWQLQRQNERLDQVAATISHDLRNPINVAQSYTELLERQIDEDGLDADEAAEALEYLGKTHKSHDRMADIIDDVLTLARESQTVEETDAVSLELVARDAWTTVDTGAASLTVTTDRTLDADRNKLRTLFENLFRNAVEHGSTNPASHTRQDAVEHGPEDVTVTVSATDDGFAVTDDGPGIPVEHQDRIFEYGYTTASGGTGLGLSIVKTMAESHGWTVTHDGLYDDGTRFVFGNVDVQPVTSRDDLTDSGTRD